MNKKLSLFSVLFLVACGGGGGGGGGGSDSGGGSGGGGSGGSIQTPTVTIISVKSEVEVGFQTTLEWSSRNATSCTASGAWSGTKGTGGTEVVTVSQAGTNTYTLSCSNSSSSASSSASVLGYRMFSGIVLDGYIRGSEVFNDTNDNNELDTDEFSVLTNNSGVFSDLKFYQGKILARDGIDLDTGFIFENFTLQTQASNDSTDYIISPVTSVGTYLANPLDINKIFGISSEIDVYSDDPIPLIDDTTYANLYSIGNRLTVLAMGVQNFEATNKDLLSYINVIASEAQTSYNNNAVSVQIDDPIFVRSVLDTILDTGVTDDFKSSLTTMLSNSLYLLQVRDNSSATTGIQNFAFTTLQDDITKLKNCNSASGCVVVNNYINDIFGYVANDQNLLLSDVSIPIQAFDDVLEVNEDEELSFSQALLLANDNYLKGTGTTFQFTNVSNGKFLSSEYQSFRYLPNQDFNGTDTFTYTIGQAGQESNGIVTINIAPVNDSPTMESRSFTNTGGSTTVFGNVDAFDVDGDSLSYAIGGTDEEYISVTGEGDLSFSNKVSYASPSDSNSDNIYEFTVTVNDGSINVTQNFSVEVQPGGSPPLFLGTASDLIFYENTSIIIQINASDPDGDEMSLSISKPGGFSINSNANGFEITNSSGLATGTYTVEGIITDYNFNTPFTFNFEVVEDITPGNITLLYEGLKANQTDQRLVMSEINRGMRFNSYRNPDISQVFAGWNASRVVQEVDWYAIQSTLGEINKNRFTISVENPHQFSVTFGGGGTDRNNTTGLLAQMGRVVPAVNDLVGNISYPQYLEMNIDRENDFNCSSGGSVSTRTSEDGTTEIFGDFSPLNDGYESSCTFSFTVDYTKKVRRSKNILDTFLNGIPDGCNENICLYPPVFHDVFGALESDSDDEGLNGLNFDIVAINGKNGVNTSVEVNGGSGDGFTVFMDPQLERPYLDREQDGYKQAEVLLDDPPNGFEENYSIDYVPYIDLKIDTSAFLEANREFEIKFITDTQNGEWEVKRDSDKSQIGGYCDTRWRNNSEEVSEKCVPVEIISIDDDSVTFKVKEYAFDGVLSEYNQSGVPPIIFFDFQIVLVNKSTQESLGFQNSYLVKLELEGDIPSGRWAQIGNDIDGKFYKAESGRSVAMDADGGIAIGAPSAADYGDNYVQVFDVTDSSITQVGEDIIGSNGVRFGHAKAVDISSDGNVLIVGAPEGGIANDAGVFGGEVTIWRNDTGWRNDTSFYGNPDLFASAGRTAAISNNGGTIIFGDNAGKTAGSWEGSAKVFRYINNTWKQIGETIYGEVNSYAPVVDINNDGTKIALGVWNYSDSRTNIGHVRIFELNQTSACLDGQAGNGCWSEIGEIRGTVDNDQCGTDISMDGNGNTIAILCSGYDGSRGQVKIFDYIDGTWAQHGNLINGENEEDHYIESGSVALSTNGDYVVIGSNWNDGTDQEAGSARIFKYNSECTSNTCSEVDTWIQVGNDIDGERLKDFSGFSVAINALGTRVAIGAPQNDGDSGDISDERGHVRIYKWVEY